MTHQAGRPQRGRHRLGMRRIRALHEGRAQAWADHFRQRGHVEHVAWGQGCQRCRRVLGEVPVRIVFDRQQAFAFQYARQRFAPLQWQGQRRRVLAGRIEIDQPRAAFACAAGQRLGTHAVFVAVHWQQAPAQCGRCLQQPRVDQRVAQDRIAIAALAEQDRRQRDLGAFGQQQAGVVHGAQHRPQPARRRMAIGRVAAAQVVGHQVGRVAARKYGGGATAQRLGQCIGIGHRRHVHAQVHHLLEAGLGRCDETALRTARLDQAALACFIESTGHRGQIDTELQRQCALRRQALSWCKAAATHRAFQRIDDAQVDRPSVREHVLHPFAGCDIRSRHVGSMSGRIVASNGGSLSITIGRFGQVTAVVVYGGRAGQSR